MIAQSQSIFGRDYYDNAYRSYAHQNPPSKMAFYKRIVEDAVGRGDGVRLLDAGCAFGRFVATLNDSWQTFGADLSLFALRHAVQSAPRARFFAADIAALPCKQAFDCIVAFDCLEHVGKIESAAQCIKSLLPGGGWFIFVVPVYDGPTGLMIKLLDHDATHVHKKSRLWWLEWASRHFRVYRCLLPGGIYVHLPTIGLRKWTQAIVVVAKNV